MTWLSGKARRRRRTRRQPSPRASRFAILARTGRESIACPRAGQAEPVGVRAAYALPGTAGLAVTAVL
ncbi:hypothetical protein [Nonomuraea typhae]|uniref:hypothetical protein n=1 Tax=Nonomuraea typhae TaxID=2603600 RepID=UPI0012FC9B18|nr:hypothetical protein [Nonomuraea typhae]